ncbi:hypothetical protein ECO9534_03130, partial [Escherichia coli O111:H11 str. CVM9534]
TSISASWLQPKQKRAHTFPKNPAFFAARFTLDAMEILNYWNLPMNCVEVH